METCEISPDFPGLPPLGERLAIEAELMRRGLCPVRWRTADEIRAMCEIEIEADDGDPSE
jgi:hypothetical protein